MGFRFNRTYVLDFSDSELEGLEVTMKSTSVGTLLKCTGGASTEEILEELVAHILNWNLEDEKGKPLPISLEPLAAQEDVLVSELARKWFAAAKGVSNPLVRTSSGGEQSQAQ